MPDSVKTAVGDPVVRPPGKRERLIGAACGLLYRQGVERTTLADIAQEADVPLGNVYYYFKTKDEIIAAVVRSHLEDVETALASIDGAHRTPKSRLKAFVKLAGEGSDLIAQYGCPQGSLCSELDKQDAGRDHLAAELIRVPIAWAEAQFRLMGRRDAHDLAVTLIASYQGAALLTNTLGDAGLMTSQTRRLTRWIDSLDLG